MRRSEQDAALDALYARVPEMTGCDGRCWISCGPAEMTARERARLREAGFRITPFRKALMQRSTFFCEALTAEHRCGAYQIRPLVCRIWGAARRIQCPYGCVPSGGFLSDAEVVALLAEAEQIGGSSLPHSLHQVDTAAADWFEAAASGGIRIRERYNIPPAFRPRIEEFACPSCGFMLTRPAGDVRLGRCSQCAFLIQF